MPDEQQQQQQEQAAALKDTDTVAVTVATLEGLRRRHVGHADFDGSCPLSEAASDIAKAKAGGAGCNCGADPYNQRIQTMVDASETGVGVNVQRRDIAALRRAHVGHRHLPGSCPKAPSDDPADGPPQADVACTCGADEANATVDQLLGDQGAGVGPDADGTHTAEALERIKAKQRHFDAFVQEVKDQPDMKDRDGGLDMTRVQLAWGERVRTDPELRRAANIDFGDGAGP
jgi:hypothetical protein